LKKSLIALAALASTGAFAQSASMTITGGIDLMYRSVSHDDATKKVNGVSNNGMYTSQLNFTGKYDLGAGTSAGFFMELDFNPQSSSQANQTSTGFGGTPFTGQQMAYLGGGFGTVRLGVPNSPGLTAGVTAQPLGTGLGSGYSGTFGRLGTTTVSNINSYEGNGTGRIIRHEKTIQYTTPNLEGVTATVEYAAKNFNANKVAAATATAAATDASASNTNGYLGLAAAYNKGPVNAILYSGKATAGSSTGTTANASGGTAIGATTGANSALIATNSALALGGSVKWLMLAGNYAIDPSLTVYLGYTTTKGEDAAGAKTEDSKSQNVAVKYTMGQIDLMANVLQRKSGLTTQAAAPKATVTGLGANYNLSDKVAVYGRYENVKNIAITGTAPNQTGQKQTITGTGVRVLF
jgi:predicted porin